MEVRLAPGRGMEVYSHARKTGSSIRRGLLVVIRNGSNYKEEISYRIKGLVIERD
jgi:hypothetical protein